MAEDEGEDEGEHEDLQAENLGEVGTLDEVEGALRRRRWWRRVAVGLAVVGCLVAAGALLLLRHGGGGTGEPLGPDPQDLYLEAQFLQGRGRIDSAIKAYREALDTPTPWSHREACARCLADLLYTTGTQRNDRAMVREARSRYEELAAVAASAEQAGWALFQAANCALALEDHAAAIELYSILLRRFPQTAHLGDAYLGLCRAATGRRDFQPARSYLRLLFEADPDGEVSAAALYALGRVFMFEAEDYE